MPTPRKGQSQSDFMGMCIRHLRREGITDNKHRIAKCLGMWRQHTGEKAPKKE